MYSSWGHNLKINLFGESHGPAIGVTLEGLPPGFPLDFSAIQAHLQRRAPGRSPWSSARQEADVPQFLSGLYQGKTTGTPLTAIIPNTDAHSDDYASHRLMPRPGHADCTGHIHYQGHQDPRGGGHFSGRLTAPLTLAGAICLQILRSCHGITIQAHIAEIASILDATYSPLNPQLDVASQSFPVINRAQGERMIAAIQSAHERGDSVGGIIEAVATGLPMGIGGPLWGRLNAQLAYMLMAIPGFKGIEFGTGFEAARMTGSIHNDPFSPSTEHPFNRASNHAGGLEGGITNGMPLILRCAVKPTASIQLPQASIDLQTHTPELCVTQGRHDPCIVPRAVPVVESAIALVLLDNLLDPSTPHEPH